MSSTDERPFVVIGKVERGEDGEVHLHLIRDEDVVHLSNDDEFVTVALKVNPWIPAVL